LETIFGCTVGALDSPPSDAEAKVRFLTCMGIASGTHALALTPLRAVEVDAAVVLVRARTTDRHALELGRDRLTALGLPVIGMIWNRADIRTVRNIFPRAKARLFTLTGRAR
jgi:hypothetical protein